MPLFKGRENKPPRPDWDGEPKFKVDPRDNTIYFPKPEEPADDKKDDKPFPFWLFNDPNMDPFGGTRTPIGTVIHGPVTLSVGDLCEFDDQSYRVTAIVHWSNPDEYVVEFDGYEETTIEHAVNALQLHELHYNGTYQGRNSHQV
jgi:hypothetical protein